MVVAARGAVGRGVLVMGVKEMVVSVCINRSKYVCEKM